MGRRVGRGRCEQDIRYSPLPSQRRFHNSKARFKGFSGPIGSGKSQALCQEALKLSYLNPGRTGLIGAPTYPMLRDATLTAFLEVLGQNNIPYELNKAELTIRFRDTRSKILFRSLEDYERLRGTNLAWFGVDELTYASEAAWLRLEGRLRDPKAQRLCGFGVWTPKGFDWVYRRFLASGQELYEVVVARAGENKHLLKHVPDFYERLKGSYDDLFYRQEVLGEYLNTTAGRAYHAFDRARNVGETRIDPVQPLLWALDFNVEPMCSVVVQRSGETFYVLDEIVLHRATTYEACSEFRSRYGGHRGPVIVYGDATGNRMQSAGGSDYEVIRRALREWSVRFEMRVPAVNPPVRERIGLMNAKLCSADGETRLVIDRKCRGLIEDLEAVTLQPGTYTINKDADPQRSHLSDAIGYLIWQESQKRATIGERNRPLF